MQFNYNKVSRFIYIDQLLNQSRAIPDPNVIFSMAGNSDRHQTDPQSDKTRDYIKVWLELKDWGIHKSYHVLFVWRIKTESPSDPKLQ